MRVTHHWLTTAEQHKLRTKFVLSLPNYTFYFESSKNKCQKSQFSTPIAFNKVIHSRDPMPSVEQRAQKDREPYTEETQADNPYHNEAFPKSKMPKKAHKPPNIPACKNSHLPIIEVFPTAKSPRKPNPTYILPKERSKNFSGHGGRQNPAFHKQLWAGVFVQAQRQMWWSCMEQHDKIATLYCPVNTPSDALKSKLALARTFMGPHSPSALHSEKGSTCSPQKPENNINQTVKGSVITHTALHKDNLLQICMSAQCGPIL